MTIRDLIQKLSDADLDKKIDVAAWREEKKNNKDFSSTEQAYIRGFICSNNLYGNSITPALPVPDIGSTIRELFGNLPDEELDKNVDNKIIDWYKKYPDETRAFFRLFIQQKNGKSWIPFADVEITDYVMQINTLSKKFISSKNEDKSYVPTKEDFVKVFRELLKYQKLEISIHQVFDAMEVKLIKKGYELHGDWRTTTEQNIKKWSK